MRIKLIRDPKMFKLATGGRLYIDDNLFCFILEDMWRNNQRDNPNTPEAEESCIPIGNYFLR